MCVVSIIYFYETDVRNLNQYNELSIIILNKVFFFKYVIMTDTLAYFEDKK